MHLEEATLLTLAKKSFNMCKNYNHKNLESLKDSIEEKLYNQYNKSLKIFYHKKSLKLYKQYNKNYKTYNKGLSNSILIQEKLKVLLFDKENLQCLKSEFKELHKQYGTKSQTLQTEKKFHT